MEPRAAGFDAVVLAMSPHARASVAGVALVERGRRVASKLGARRVLVVERADDLAALTAWGQARGDHALVVIAAGDQLVHTPLVAPLLAATGERRLAVGPDGAYAGALWAEGAAIDDVLAALATAPATADRDLAARWTDAARVEHGDIARHPATTAAERRDARRMLFGLIVKGEDGPVSKYIYRPVSRVLTRALVHTPITPNQVSMVVGLLGMLGCWFTAQGDRTGLWLGAALVLLGGFIDGCDGEIARLKLEFSRIGAWVDTIVDETTTTVYLIAIGLHAHHRMPDATWIVPSIVVGTVAYLLSVYCIYWFLIVVSKTGNSQHYVGKLDLVDDPALGPALRRPPPTASSLPPWLRTVGVGFSHMIRRDFINLAALALAVADQYLLIYGTMLVGGVLTVFVVGPEHVRLRRQVATLRRRGASPRLLPS
jgi:phosphatidylglycerophosphate synthase